MQMSVDKYMNLTINYGKRGFPGKHATGCYRTGRNLPKAISDEEAENLYSTEYEERIHTKIGEDD